MPSSVTSLKQLAAHWRIKYSSLIYWTRVVDRDKQYKVFNIGKKNGGKREITAPHSRLIMLQENLKDTLELIYKPKACVYGFVKDGGIVKNARNHLRKRHIANVDLRDFFPSINFGRVRGVLMAEPFGFNQEIATVLANIATYKGMLPQGAPSSPVISNIICYKMDGALMHLAKMNKCIYTRYADDLTFSTSLREFPFQIMRIDEYGSTVVGDALREIIIDNGFTVNADKCRLQSGGNRKIVTGLVVNQKLNVKRTYIRNIRAMLYAWDKYGYTKACAEFLNKHYRKNSVNKSPKFHNVLRGKLNYLKMVRGSDGLYESFRSEYYRLFIRDKSIIDDGATEKGGGAGGRVQGDHSEVLIREYSRRCQHIYGSTSDGEMEGGVWIVTDYRNCRDGTAFFIHDIGWVTCFHCVSDGNGNVGDDIRIQNQRQPGVEYSVQVIKSHPHYDLAILAPAIDSIPGGYAFIVAPTPQVSRGNSAKILGYPSRGPAAQCNIMNVHVTGVETRSAANCIMVNGIISSGNSGGPLINDENQVIGVVVSGMRGTGGNISDDNVCRGIGHLLEISESE